MEWAARMNGVFYVVRGLFVIRQAVFNWRLERIYAAIAPGQTSLAERVSDVWHGMGGVLVILAGLSLALLHRWAVVAMLICWAAQAVYLLWAQRWLKPADPIAAQGRRQTINAFALFSAATLLTLWLNGTGLLT